MSPLPTSASLSRLLFGLSGRIRAICVNELTSLRSCDPAVAVAFSEETGGRVRDHDCCRPDAASLTSGSRSGARVAGLARECFPRPVGLPRWKFAVPTPTSKTWILKLVQRGLRLSPRPRGATKVSSTFSDAMEPWGSRQLPSLLLAGQFGQPIFGVTSILGLHAGITQRTVFRKPGPLEGKETRPKPGERV